MNKETIAVLDAVKDVLSNPERWSKGQLASLSQQEPAPLAPNDPRAGCWCLMGAVGKVMGHGNVGSIDEDPVFDALTETLGERGYAGQCPPDFAPCEWVPHFNDAPETTHADVLALIDETIERLRHE